MSAYISILKDVRLLLLLLLGSSCGGILSTQVPLIQILNYLMFALELRLILIMMMAYSEAAMVATDPQSTDVAVLGSA